MSIIDGTGLGHPLRNAGAPAAGTNAVCTLTFANITSGTFKLQVANGDGSFEKTAAITWSATNATLVSNIDAALEALALATGSDDLTPAAGTMTSGLGTLTITAAASGAFEKEPIVITVADKTLVGTGADITSAMTTPGVWPTGRSAPKGAKLIDTTNGVDYINTGMANKPVWTKVGTQS